MSGKKHIPVIGLTGGAGSGKSYIAGLLEEICKVCHINTDMISRLQMQKGGCVYHKVVEYFGSEFLDAQGEIDRKKLGEYIFQRPEELMQLNAMTHPPVKEEVSRLIEEAGRGGYDVILLESALLIEAGYKDICDDVWYVYANRKIRRKRLQETRGYSEARVLDMFRRQQTDKFFREHADYVIENNAGEAEVLKSRLYRRLHKVSSGQI